jgi:hypothetical protein
MGSAYPMFLPNNDLIIGYGYTGNINIYKFAYMSDSNSYGTIEALVSNSNMFSSWQTHDGATLGLNYVHNPKTNSIDFMPSGYVTTSVLSATSFREVMGSVELTTKAVSSIEAYDLVGSNPGQTGFRAALPVSRDITANVSASSKSYPVFIASKGVSAFVSATPLVNSTSIQEPTVAGFFQTQVVADKYKNFGSLVFNQNIKQKLGSALHSSNIAFIGYNRYTDSLYTLSSNSMIVKDFITGKESILKNSAVQVDNSCWFDPYECVFYYYNKSNSKVEVANASMHVVASFASSRVYQHFAVSTGEGTQYYSDIKSPVIESVSELSPYVITMTSAGIPDTHKQKLALTCLSETSEVLASFDSVTHNTKFTVAGVVVPSSGLIAGNVAVVFTNDTLPAGTKTIEVSATPVKI